MSFSPKETYLLNHSTEATEWSSVVKTSTAKNAATFALANMASKGASTEQLEGANLFMQELFSIGDKRAEPVAYKPKKLSGMESEKLVELPKGKK